MSARYQIIPSQLAAKKSVLSLAFRAYDMPRLMEILSDGSSEINADFKFYQDEFGDKLTIKSAVDLSVICHRCNDNMQINIEVDAEILLLDSAAELKNLADEIDGIVAGGELSLKDVLEDELILAMPMMPKHKLADCKAGKYFGKGDSPQFGKQQSFADLNKIWRNINGSTTES